MLNQPVVGLSLAVTLGAAVLFASCSDPVIHTPSAPSAPGFLAAEIVGPLSIPPGQTAQFTANARFADGTVKLITPDLVRWQSSNATLLRFGAAGVASAALIRGEVIISAEVTLAGTRRTASRSVGVMSEGTFRVAGNVRESDPANTAIGGALVEVTPGGARTFTDASGQYRLYEVPASAEIRVSAPGYVTETRSLTLSAHATEDFRLALAGPRFSLSGDYTLAIDVLGGCSGAGALAPDLQHRSYDAVLTQSGSSIDVFLPESRFRLNSISRGNRFKGTTQGAATVFSLEQYDSYYYPFYGPLTYPNLVEALGDGTFLVTSGTATLVGSDNTASGALNGAMAQWASRFPVLPNSVHGVCSGPIRLTLTRK